MGRKNSWNYTVNRELCLFFFLWLQWENDWNKRACYVDKVTRWNRYAQFVFDFPTFICPAFGCQYEQVSKQWAMSTEFVRFLHPQSALLTGSEFSFSHAVNKIKINIANRVVFISYWSKITGLKETFMIYDHQLPQMINTKSSYLLARNMEAPYSSFDPSERSLLPSAINTWAKEAQHGTGHQVTK